MFLFRFLVNCTIALILTSFNVAKSQSTIAILDENRGLPFVNIVNTSLNQQQTTDEFGNATIPKEWRDEHRIVISYIGFEELTLTVLELESKKNIILTQGVHLEEITLIGRTDQRTSDILNQIETVGQDDIQMTNPQNSADALGQHAGVFVQKSQMGGGSPIIRGFEANKILLVVDGVRMNNAIYRSGHLQNAITIDPSILEKVEVIHGPGSIVYGSDAIGGIIHFRTMRPKLNVANKLFEGNAYFRYSSANHEKTVHTNINYGLKKWGFLFSITASDFDHLKSGNNRPSRYPDFGKRNTYIDRLHGKDTILINEDANVQIGTAFGQIDILQKSIYRHSNELKFATNIQYSTSRNIPRYDALIEENDEGNPKFAEWYYGPQKRFLISGRVDYKKRKTWFDKIIAIISYQKIQEDRVSRKFSDDNYDIMNEDVHVWTMTTDFSKLVKKEWKINYGLELQHNNVVSKSFEKNIQNDSLQRGAFTRYPSEGSSLSGLAAYILVNKNIRKGNLAAGIRYSWNSLKIKYSTQDAIQWPSSFYEGLSSTNSSVTGSLGIKYYLSKKWQLNVQLASAFRTPNIDDIGKIRINSNEVSVPNVNLVPEYSYTGELSLIRKINNSYIGGTVFGTHVYNVIVRQDFVLPDGSAYLVNRGDSLKVVSNVNVNKAEVWGFSLNMSIQLFKHCTLIGSANYVKGISLTNSKEEQPLAHIPPFYGNVSLQYQVGNQFIQAVWRYNAHKPISEFGGSTDNPEFATPEGALAWNTWNLYYKNDISSNLSISASVENIFDLHYRNFSSGLSAPGRNFSATLRYNF